MNERIQQLAKQAGLEGSNGHYEYDWFDPEKFVELIVKECAQRAEDMGGDQRIPKDLFEHFGIKKEPVKYFTSA